MNARSGFFILFFLFAGVAACASPDKDAAYYTCPMHPQIRADQPGQCPICGMNLVPVSKGTVNKQHEGSNNNNSHAVTIEPSFTQAIGVVTEKIMTRPLVKTITAFGKAAHDRDLWVAQNEFIEALKLGDRNLVESTRSKLVFMGLSDDWIAELKKTRKSDHGLHLSEGNGSNFFEAYVSQDDVTSISVGDVVAILNTQGRELAVGAVKAVSTLVDPNSRTVRVLVKSADKIEVKLNTFVQFRILTDLGERLSVPHRAVLFNGDATLIYVAEDGGRFEARPVKLGLSAGDFEEIVEGVAENESVVVNGHFLIDAETQIKLGASEGHQH